MSIGSRGFASLVRFGGKVKISKIGRIMGVAMVLWLAACANNSDDKNGGGGGGPGPQGNRINWSSVPANFHPTTEDFAFRIENIEKISVNAFSFKDDAEVVYSDDVAPNTGYVRIFKVWNESVSWGNHSVRSSGKTVELQSSGVYQCQITVTNNQITKLKGGCYVRLQVVLPKAVEIEVYNLGQLISQRFIPIDAETFLENFDDASFDEEKFAAIEEYLNSYTGMAKKPNLTALQLGKVVGDFPFSDDKFKALERLHAVVSDRENLGAMIEEKFSRFDQPKARQICGI